MNTLVAPVLHKTNSATGVVYNMIYILTVMISVYSYLFKCTFLYLITMLSW